MSKIVVACDHRGDDFCKNINKYLVEQGHEVTLILSQSPTDDYIDNGKIALKLLKDKKVEYAILVCGTGIGMAIIANRQKGIFAVHAKEEADAYFAKRHENANVLVFGSGYSDGVKEVKLCKRKAKRIIQTFLDTPFEGDRHIRRIKKVDQE